MAYKRLTDTYKDIIEMSRIDLQNPPKWVKK